MSTREEINALMKRTNIKGKDYIDVANRVQGFWALFPEGRIETELLNFDGEMCVFKASVYNMGALLATGHAWEVKGATPINRTSFLEVCETSAIGRAIGNAGIGSTESIASADEVMNAQEAQERRHTPTADGNRGKPKNAPQSGSQGDRGALLEELKELKAEALSLGIKDEGMASGIATICEGFKVDEKGGWITKDMSDYELKSAVDRIRSGIADKRKLMGDE